MVHIVQLDWMVRKTRFAMECSIPQLFTTVFSNSFGLQFKCNKSLEFSVCISALFALTYLISSTILRETYSEAIFIFPSQYLPAICKLAGRYFIYDNYYVPNFFGNLMFPCYRVTHFCVTVLPCYLVTLLPCYLVTVLPCYRVTMLPCYLVTLLPCYPVIPCYCVTLSPCYRVTLSPCCSVTVLPCYRVTLSPCYRVTLLQCYRVTLLQCYPATVFPCYRVTVLPGYRVALLPCYLVTLLPCNLVFLLPCYLVTFLACYPATLLPCYDFDYFRLVEPVFRRSISMFRFN